jgi:methylthioribose-1-phosphate isomerase
LKTLEWRDGALELIDQTRLPHEVVILRCTTCAEVASAIKEMRVRGAPAIGVTGAFGLVLAALSSQASNKAGLVAELEAEAESLAATRPTAVNLRWGIDRILRRAQTSDGSPSDVASGLLSEALDMAREDEETNRRMGALGADLVPEKATILTHCNAGALATVDYGTALGVVRAAWEQGKKIRVLADETRPFLQGARLTAWELSRDGIPVTLITDSMAGHFMRTSRVDLVIVGADRIAANGDVANKIGTYSVAVLAKENGIPFYVAAPFSTVDASLSSGEQIPIEERSPDEVLCFAGHRVAPDGVSAFHPAFDVTPSRYVTAIITERGVLWPPFGHSIAEAQRGDTGSE